MSETTPGFTAAQTWALRQLIREAVAEGIAAAEHRDCTAMCTRVEEARETLYGNSSDGLKTTVTELKTTVAALVWWYRALVVAVVSSWVAMLVSFCQ